MAVFHGCIVEIGMGSFMVARGCVRIIILITVMG